MYNGISMDDQIHEILRKEADAILNIPINKSYSQSIELIHNHVHMKHGKLITSGMGKAGQVANNIATTFSSTGTPSFFLHPSEAQHGDLGILQPHDVLLLISNSGKTREIIELVNLSKGLVPDIKIIVISGSMDAPLSKVADVLISTGNPAEVCPLGLSPTTSTTVMTVIGDTLVVLMMKKINFTASDYAKRHHGGYLGEKSRNYIELNNSGKLLK